MVNVVHLLYSLDFGGIETHRYIIAKYWPSNSNYRLMYWVITKCGRIYDLIKNEGHAVDMHCFEHNKVTHPVDVLVLWDLLMQTKKTNVDIIHTVGAEANLMGGIIAKIRGIPLVAEEVGVPTRSEKAKWVFSHYWKIVPHKIIAISYAVRKYLVEEESAPPHRIVTIYNPFDMEVHKASKDEIFRKTEKKEKIIVYVGRIDKIKNLKFLINVVNQIRSQIADNVQLYIVGDGEERKNLEMFVNKIQAKGFVKFLGFLHPMEIANIFRKAYLFVLPSLNEGLSLSALEAISNGVLPLLTNRGGAIEVVPHNIRSQLTFSPFNPKELQQKILWALSLTRDEYVRFVLELQRWVFNHFSPYQYITKLENVYKDIKDIR